MIEYRILTSAVVAKRKHATFPSSTALKVPIKEKRRKNEKVNFPM